MALHRLRDPPLRPAQLETRPFADPGTRSRGRSTRPTQSGAYTPDRWVLAGDPGSNTHWAAFCMMRVTEDPSQKWVWQNGGLLHGSLRAGDTAVAEPTPSSALSRTWPAGTPNWADEQTRGRTSLSRRQRLRSRILVGSAVAVVVAAVDGIFVQRAIGVVVHVETLARGRTAFGRPAYHDRATEARD